MIIIRKKYIYGGDKIGIFIVKPGAVLRGLLNNIKYMCNFTEYDGLRKMFF